MLEGGGPRRQQDRLQYLVVVQPHQDLRRGELVFRNAVGRIVIVIPALDLELAEHQRGRASRQAHATRRGQYFGTLIHHARDRRCAFAAETGAGCSAW
jgi:hypothetical protein